MRDELISIIDQLNSTESVDYKNHLDSLIPLSKRVYDHPRAVTLKLEEAHARECIIKSQHRQMAGKIKKILELYDSAS